MNIHFGGEWLKCASFWVVSAGMCGVQNSVKYGWQPVLHLFIVCPQPTPFDSPFSPVTTLTI
jgi:hypothetical protein